MFLKRLEISGFKSFTEKIKLDFPEGITAIVGPNGSGKSNIGDAIRWVMGEQSAKSLRGAKMEDIIFSGTQHRKPLGYAEVQMIIDNSSGFLLTDFSEVTITRRLFRSGESEYLINGSLCRMKDIHRLFMDTGVGREGYSIIGQGRVDEILSASSVDRRHLFEEAAGIVKYKTRRHEAFLKLDREKQNLERVNDLIEELASQIEPLSQQAAAAKEFLNLRDQYKIIHINLFLREAAAAEEESKRINSHIANLSAQSEKEKYSLSSVEDDIQSLKAEEADAEAEYKETNRQIIHYVAEIEKAKSNIRLAERIKKEIEQHYLAITQKQKDFEIDEAALSKMAAAKSDKVALEQRIFDLSQKQQKLVKETETLRAEAMTVQQRLHAALSRQKLLVEMERGHEGYYNSVKAVFDRKNNDPSFGKGIVGTVSEMLTVPQEYEVSISVTLGGAAQNIITFTEADAQRAISYLKSAKAGRATFLPVSAMKPRSINGDRLLKEPGVIGLANTLVSFDQHYKPVYDYLLGNVFVVENLQRAVELSRKYHQAHRLVTLEGDLISPGGAMTGGSSGRQATDLLGRRRHIEELHKQIAVLQTKEKDFEISQHNLNIKLSTVAVEITKLNEEKIQNGLIIQSLQTAQGHADRQAKELETMKLQKAALETELSAIDPKLAGDLAVELEKLEKSQKAIEERIANYRTSISKAEEMQKEHMEVIARLNKESARLEARCEQMESDSRRLHNEIWESYNMTFQSAQEFHKPELPANFLRQEEKRLKAEISALGDVNIGAIEAYKTLNERHNFLISQRDDILEAEEQLQEIIQKLTEQMEQQFITQFSLIAKHFNDVFREMFGGGNAGLTMSDPGQALESGIEISAQPPGKNLQSLSLLSGGERALTAIALLFGILRMKPAPFCVLDEIESALDDANVIRFSQFIKLHSKDTQFIVITHRKGTMECADTLYGVTMQEQGISKMVSVDFR